MQVTETVTEGLKREFQVTVPAADLEARVAGRLAELKDRVQLRGFRPGKVPVTHLRKVYGRSVMAETVETVIRELNAQIVEERGLRLAREPKVTIPNEETEVDRVISGQADLAYTLSFEVLPAITLADFGGIKLERLVADVADAEIDAALNQIAEQNRPYAAKGEGAKVEQGDRVVIDFIGRIDGAPFAGGTGNDVAVNVGSNQFIPGFEDQLVGIVVGEMRLVKVTFPAAYPTETLAGKAAEFDVTAKAIEAPTAVAVDDEFAKSLGLESLEKLRDAVKARLARDHAAMSRQKLKRKLLDQLDALHKFTPPPTLVEDEFASIWTTIEADLKRQNRTFADEGTTEEKAREEYRAIAERRVRLGLLLAEIGEKNSIKVSDEEISRAIVERARQVPGREQEVWDYYRKNPQAMAGIRAPIYEEKVVDFLLELAKVTDKTVSKDELFKEDDDEPAAAAPA
jgi:trigger factor